MLKNITTIYSFGNCHWQRLWLNCFEISNYLLRLQHDDFSQGASVMLGALVCYLFNITWGWHIAIASLS